MRPRHAVLLITPPKSSYPFQLLSRQQSALVSPLAATLMNLPASGANKRLTVRLNPLDATLAKKGFTSFKPRVFLFPRHALSLLFSLFAPRVFHNSFALTRIRPLS